MNRLDEKKRVLSFEERIDPANTALVIVDVQNDFVSPQGVCGVIGDDISSIPAMIKRLIPLIESARKADMLIVFLRTIYDHPVLSPALAEQYERRGYPNSICLTGTAGAEFVEGVCPRDAPNEVVVTKHRYSAFWGSSLDLTLRSNGIRTVVLTGIATEVCVESTARDAFFLDYQVALADDCMSSFSEDRHAATLTVVARSFGVVAPSPQIRAVWDRALPGPRNWQTATKKDSALWDLGSRLRPSNAALLLVNMQPRFLDITGVGSHMQAILPRVKEMLNAARQSGCMVIHAYASYEPSVRYEGLLGAVATVERGRARRGDAQFVAGLEPCGDEQVVHCQRFSAFADTPLALLLRSNGIRTLVVAGLETECAIESTTRDAADRDFHCVVAADAVATHHGNSVLHDQSLQVMARYFALVRPATDIVAQWVSLDSQRMRAKA